MKEKVVRLSECCVGSCRCVRRLAVNEAQLLRRLQALGVAVGQEICLMQKFPSYVVACGTTKLAFDARLAAQIWVENPGADVKSIKNLKHV